MVLCLILTQRNALNILIRRFSIKTLIMSNGKRMAHTETQMLNVQCTQHNATQFVSLFLSWMADYHWYYRALRSLVQVKYWYGLIIFVFRFFFSVFRHLFCLLCPFDFSCLYLISVILLACSRHTREKKQ